jgi:hypothetical protein
MVACAEQIAFVPSVFDLGHDCVPIPVFTEGHDLEALILLGTRCRWCGREVLANLSQLKS